jgi:hypothetical protein
MGPAAAPLGNKNALKHGLYSAEAIEMRRAVRELNRQGRKLAETIKQPSACSRPAVALGGFERLARSLNR